MENTIQPTSEVITENIKLIKNTKGYNWEIRVIGLDVDKVAKINDIMVGRFGNEAN
jgi:hypothetical protein